MRERAARAGLPCIRRWQVGGRGGLRLGPGGKYGQQGGGEVCWGHAVLMLACSQAMCCSPCVLMLLKSAAWRCQHPAVLSLKPHAAVLQVCAALRGAHVRLPPPVV